MTHVALRFDTEGGPARTDFFVSSWPRHPDLDARATLGAHLRMISAPPGTWPVRSVYAYRRTAELDEEYARTADELRGAHLNEVIGFARWTAGELDMLVAVEDGEVVFDLLRGEAVEPWEFR